MKIVEKIVNRQRHNGSYPGVTVTFFGDSVTQGCFDVYIKDDMIETVYDKSGAYHKYFAEIFEFLCPNVPVNVINAGRSGAKAPQSLKMIDELVLKNNPDLTVVCFGLNDALCGKECINMYLDSLSGIFDKLRENGSEIIFMTPNMCCTEISPHLKDEMIIDVAKRCCEVQNGGVLDFYIDAAVKLCEEKGVVVCDCYSKWKTLSKAGINTTELLSNKINHPTREMNKMFAYSLVETIFNS